MGLYLLILTLLTGIFEKGEKTDADYTHLGTEMVAYGEFPYAVYYFTKALELNPDNQIARAEREKVWEKLGISLPPEKRHRFSPYQAYWVLLFLTASAWIWTGNRWLRKGLYAGLVLLALLPLVFFLGKGFSPLTGIVVKPTLLYTEGREGASVVDFTPIQGGEMVRVMGVEGEWLWVMTSDDKLGFIPKETTRV